VRVLAPWSQTVAGAASDNAVAPPSLVVTILGPSFGSPICDQLVDQAAVGRNIGEEPPHPLGRGAAPRRSTSGLLSLVA
jgi:hypothetical protein